MDSINCQFNLHCYTSAGKECELFVTIVSMASNNLGSYTCLITLLKRKPPSADERNIKIVQGELFNNQRGGIFDPKRKINLIQPN